MSLFSRTLIQMYRRLGSKHLFQKKWTALLLYPDATKPKMIRKHPLLVLLSVLCKSLQRSLIFYLYRSPFLGVCFVRKSGCKGTAFFNTLQMFRKKSLRKLAVFLVILQNKGKTGHFRGNGRKKGKAVVREQAVYICHYREISAPLSFNYFLLIIYRGLERRKGRAGWAKKGGGRRKKPRLPSPGKAQKPTPILRDGLGIRSGWKAVRGQVDFSCKRSYFVIARRLGSKVG